MVGTVWLDPRSRSAAASVDLHSQERQTPLPTSYSVSQPRFAEASVANALRALATLTAIITRLPLSKIERINHLQHTLLSNALTPFAFQQAYLKCLKSAIASNSNSCYFNYISALTYYTCYISRYSYVKVYILYERIYILY